MSQTQYIPRGSDLVASAFRRLDEKVADLRRQVALSSLWSWNYAAIMPANGAWNRSHLSDHNLKPNPVERKRTRWELAVAAVLACFAFCACGDVPRSRELTRPEIATLLSPEGIATWDVDYAWEQAGTGKIVIVGWRKNQ